MQLFAAESCGEVTAAWESFEDAAFLKDHLIDFKAPVSENSDPN